MADFDLIIGVHSIAAAMKNPEREIKHIFFSEEGKKDLLKRSDITENELNKHETTILDSHKLQEKGKEYCKTLGVDFQRIPSGVFIITSEIETKDNNWLYEQVAIKDDLKILCLDQISDVHNGAAILRTASFYGIDIVILPGKKSFGFTPSFYRIASGATEYLDLVQAGNLSKIISTLTQKGITCIGLTEHVESPITEKILEDAKLGTCLVLGKEETGISHSVLRNIQHQLALIPAGDTRSLNVSVAAAISMEKCFSKSFS
jgi:23S rRNA (guanosine2251-2'-O)-methyltransferase